MQWFYAHVCIKFIKFLKTLNFSLLICYVFNALWFYTGGDDYDSGPYSVTIKAGDTSAQYCIDIYNDTVLEMDETFNIRINETALHSDIVLMEPNTAKVTIIDDECKHSNYEEQYINLAA